MSLLRGGSAALTYVRTRKTKFNTLLHRWPLLKISVTYILTHAYTYVNVA